MLQTILEFCLRLQKRFALLILIFGLVLAVICAPRAIKLLSTIKTDLIHLLPDHYPSVHYTEKIQKTFNRRSSLFLILNSPDAQANLEAMFATKAYLETLPSVQFVETQKRGYDFFDQNKLLLIDLKDLYQIHDRLKDKIQKEKLGGLYIDFSEDDQPEQAVTFDDLIKKFKEEFNEGVRNRYKTNENGTVIVLNIYPKSTDDSLSYFKKFGDEIDRHVQQFDFKKYHPEMTFGYAGAIKTRVDQYDTLISDLKIAGIISLGSILLALYFYFWRFVKGQRKDTLSYYLLPLQRLIPVAAVFVPMLIATLIAFCVCAFFIKQLNVVTSFLFSIIFGMGVDNGIHLMTRYFQDKAIGLSMDEIHRKLITSTSKSIATSVLTTVASFYILIINDFRGFSEFGWIAGNGLIITMICYIIMFPCIILVIDRFGLISVRRAPAGGSHLPKKHQWIPHGKMVFAICVALFVLAIADVANLKFEWNFGNLKMRLAHREQQKTRLRETVGRVNSPAVYLIDNEVQARAVRQVLRERKEANGKDSTIHFFRSWYDMVPLDQEEKMALLQDIDIMLQDDVLNTLKDNEKQLVGDFREAISKTNLIKPEDIPADVVDIFWGDSGQRDVSVAYIMPLPHLDLDNGEHAQNFYDEVHFVGVLKDKFYALSDAMVFAEVLKTLFRDTRIAISLSTLIMILLIGFHYRNFKKTGFVLLTLASGITGMFGVMALLGIKLNFYNMVVIPNMIGMGEDNCVHIMDRYEENHRRSIVEVLRTSGGAAFMASLTTILGFGGMIFTHHPGLVSIGLMAIIGMTACLISSLVLLPLMLQLFLKPREYRITNIEQGMSK